MCSLFLTSSLGWHVKQDFLILGCPASVAVNGCFEITMKGKNGGTGRGGRQLQTETVQELH